MPVAALWHAMGCLPASPHISLPFTHPLVRHHLLQTAMSALVDNDNCNQTDNAAAGQALAEGLAAAADSPRAQALLFRAFAIQYCHGDFNTLFSGNGYTYTGACLPRLPRLPAFAFCWLPAAAERAMAALAAPFPR